MSRARSDGSVMFTDVLLITQTYEESAGTRDRLYAVQVALLNATRALTEQTVVMLPVLAPALYAAR